MLITSSRRGGGNVEMWKCGNLWELHPIPIPPHPHTLITHHTSHMYSYINHTFLYRPAKPILIHPFYPHRG